jgi:hypothetical protein
MMVDFVPRWNTKHFRCFVFDKITAVIGWRRGGVFVSKVNTFDMQDSFILPTKIVITYNGSRAAGLEFCSITVIAIT